MIGRTFIIFSVQLLAAQIESYSFRGPSDVVVKQGDNVILTCSTGTLDYVMRWSRSYSLDDDTGKVMYGGRTSWDSAIDRERFSVKTRENGTVDLVILNATVQDAAWYICKDAKNALGIGRAFVSIFDDSLPLLDRKVKKSNIVEHRCQFKYAGLLRPTIEWIGQGGEVIMDVSRSDNNVDGEFVESTIITPLNEQQTWPKTCRVVFTSTNGSQLSTHENDNDIFVADDDAWSFVGMVRVHIVPIIIATALVIVFVWAVIMTVKYSKSESLRHRSLLEGMQNECLVPEDIQSPEYDKYAEYQSLESATTIPTDAHIYVPIEITGPSELLINPDIQ